MTERQIIVRDKNGNKIAVFSNTSTIHTQESSKNLMVSPTVEIVSNGESTLTFQMQSDSDKWQQIKHPENLYYCNNRVYTVLDEQSIVYNGPIVTVTAVEIWYLLRRKYVQAHNVNTKIEAIDEHTVKILPKTKTTYKLTVNGKTYNDNQVKDSRGVIMPRGSAGYALWALLKGTDWTLGVCDVLPTGFNAAKDYGSFNVESDMKDVLENIQLVQSLYGGILVWDSLHKVLHLRDESKSGTDFNTWKGFSIRKGKNLTEYPEISWDNDIITRLYPLGNGNLNIAKVNGNKNYIDNFSFTNKIYEGYLQNENIYDTNDTGGQNSLKFWAQEQLKKYCKPRKSISYSITDIRGTDEGGFETFDVNDIVKAYYVDSEDGKEKFEYLRIQHIEYNWFFPNSDTTLEVGDKISNTTELFYQIYKDTQNSIATDSNGNISGNNVSVSIPEEYWEELFGDDYDLYGDGGYYADMNYITKLYAEHITENEEGIQENKARVEVVATELEAQVQLEASHYKETSEGISKNTASINLVANDLSAQISLEAQHHAESLQYTVDAVAGLRTYVDGDFAQNTLSAAYKYTDKETGEVSDALAEFKQVVSEDYATQEMVSSVNENVASIKATADANASWIELNGDYVITQAEVIENYADDIKNISTTIENTVSKSISNFAPTQIGSSGGAFIAIEGRNIIITGGSVSINGDVDINGKHMDDWNGKD